MNSEEEQRLLAPVGEEEDDDSTTPKPDDVPGPCTRKRKGVTRSEFEHLQVQVSSVTAAINNFGDMLKSFIGDAKKPRFDNEVLAAQSASYSSQVAASAAHAATFLGDQTTFAATQSASGPNNLVPSYALQSHPNEEAAPFTPFASPGHESLLSVEAMETGFNPVYSDPDFSLVNVALQSSTDQDSPAQEAPAPPALEEDIPQIAYEGDEAKGPDVSASLATYVEGCVTKKIKKDDMEAYLKRFPAPGNCPSLKSPLMDKEVWRAMSRDQRHGDVSLQAAQSKIAKAITVNLRLKEALVAQKSTPKPLPEFLSSLNQHIMTVIPILGNAFLDVHNSRRHKVKSKISESYWNIVQPGPLNGHVFGGKVADAVKEMTEGAKFSRMMLKNYPRSGQGHGRGYSNTSWQGQGRGRGFSQNKSLNWQGPSNQYRRGRFSGYSRRPQRQLQEEKKSQ